MNHKENIRNSAHRVATVAIESDLNGECRADMLETAAELYRMSNWVSGDE